ncbi:unnamed protein product [Effrenium voratum]|nr:unnamed protein product [Effrenium voratum]
MDADALDANCSRAETMLAALLPSGSTSLPGVSAEVTSSSTFLRMIDLAHDFARQELESRNQTMPEKCCTIIAWSCANLDAFPGPLFSLLAQLVVCNVQSCESYELTNMLWAFAKLYKLRPELAPQVQWETQQLVNAVAWIFQHRGVQDLKTQVLSSALVSVATLPGRSRSSSWLFSACGQELAERWDEVTVQSRPQISFAFKLMRGHNLQLVRNVERALAEKRPEMVSFMTEAMRGKRRNRR